MKDYWNIKDKHQIDLTKGSILMGIINITPDSFSDGGKYFSVSKAVNQAKYLKEQGAHILDIGGESSRPNATPISSGEEIKRIVPVIEAIKEKKIGLPISIDTYRVKTAKAALDAGAHIINDIFGLQKEPELANLIAQRQAGIIIMHTGREREKEENIWDDQVIFFSKSLEIAEKAGIKQNQIVLDPGFGFAKTTQENIKLLSCAEKLKQFGFPLLAGTSRKGFLGKVSGQKDPKCRDISTAATSTILRLKGFSIFRVHDIQTNKQALSIADAIKTEAAC